jgi:hypothetical protein
MMLAKIAPSQSAGPEAGARITLSMQWDDAAFWRRDGAKSGVGASSAHLDLFGGASDIINAATAVDAAGTEKISVHGGIAVPPADNGMPDQMATEPARSAIEDYGGGGIEGALMPYNDIGSGMLNKSGATGVFAAYEPGGDGAAAHVPEPWSCAIVAFGLIIILILRRRRWFSP